MNSYSLFFSNTLFLLFFSFTQNIAQNTTCEDALIVSAGTYEVTGFSGNGAVFQGATAAAWYRFEPTTSGVFTVSSCDGGGDTRLVIMLLDDCSNTAGLQIINAAEDNCADGKGGQTASIIEAVATAGISYVIYWDNGQSEDGFTWNLSFEPAENSGEGATCETAIPITVGEHQVDSLTGVGAAFSDAVSAKWYQYIPEENKALAINACENNVNTRLFIFEEGCTVSQIIGQNDDGCGSSGASILEEELIVDSGSVYYIYWDDHWSKEGFVFQLDLVDFSSSLQEPAWAKNINLYPNPANHSLFVDYEFLANTDLAMTIYNGLGQALLRENWTAFYTGKVTIPIADFPAGLYFLRLTSEEGQITRQFVVNRN